MKKALVMGLAMGMAVMSLSGCTSSRERMYECMDQGISRDTCYLAEQNRKAAINAAAEKQALENATNASFEHSSHDESGKNHHHHHHSDY